MRTFAVVFGGGASRRMGEDKLLLPRRLHGKTTIIDHVIETALAVAGTAFVLSGSDRSTKTWPTNRVIVVPDTRAYEGPLQAFASFWSARDRMTEVADWTEAEHEMDEEAAVFFLLAGDLPGLHLSVLQACLTNLRTADADVQAVLVERQGRVQPLLGCYRLAALQKLADVAAKGEVRLMSAAVDIRVRAISSDEAGWPDWWVRPVHTREDYQAWIHASSRES